MSDHDRGAYTPPTDSPLSFDARRPVRGGGGGSSILLISAVILLVLIVGAGVWLYRDGLRGADDAPQPVGAAVEAAKVEPKSSDQPEADPAAGLTIHTDDGGLPGEPTFAPEPEPVLPRPAPTTTTTPTTAELRPAVPAAAQPKPAAPVAVAPKPVAPKPAAPTPAPTVGGAAMVQIGAFSSQALADRGWNDAAAVSPGMAAGKGKQVETVDKDGKTLFRTSVTGFASRADATAFCDRLKAAGKSCFVK
jgi:cell division septation protein DedD